MKDKEMFSDFFMDIPDYALKIMLRMRQAGEEIYIVGGSVRDALLGKTPNDYDMATSALPEKTLSVFDGLHIIETGLRHGTLTLISDSHPIEITTFRIDGEYTDLRRPDSVSFTRSLYEDLARRDFTVNAMAYSDQSGLCDPFGGREDLRSGIVRAVGTPSLRFREDALRIMRAFRFCAVLGFDIEEKTLEAAREQREGLLHISRERICAELERLIAAPNAQKALMLMKKCGILPYVLGNIIPSDRVVKLISKMPKIAFARLGFLLSEADEASAREVLNSLKCSNAQKSCALAICNGAKSKIHTPLDARRFRAKHGEYASLGALASVLLGNSPNEAAELVEGDCSPTKISELAVSGKELTELGYSGKALGEALDFLLSRVIENPKLNTKEELISLLKKTEKE